MTGTLFLVTPRTRQKIVKARLPYVPVKWMIACPGAGGNKNAATARFGELRTGGRFGDPRHQDLKAPG
jgi:hypothetical protein